MSYTPIGVIREELRAEIMNDGDINAEFRGYELDGVIHNPLIDEHDDHECRPGCCWDSSLPDPDPWPSFYTHTNPAERPPFRWAGAPARWPRREVTCGEQ